jgi:starch-binding outer membrane protein, SusD/RagB family
MNSIKKYLKITILGLGLIGCTKTEYIADPNNPTVESVLNGASRIQIDQLGVGVQSVMRNGLFDFYTWSGSIGREVVYFAKTESRFYRELQGEIPFDNAGIMYNWYFAFNQTRRRAEILSQSADKSPNLSAAEKAAVKGFAKTVQAHVMLNCLLMNNATGIRTTFSDLNSPGDLLKPGCFKTFAEGLAYVKTLATEGAAALDQGGSSFPFRMVAAWAGYNTPSTFKRFNQAVAARIALHAQDWAGVLTALNGSFLDLNGTMNVGPRFSYSTTAGDATNPIWQAKDEANNPILVQVNFRTEAEAGDTRVFGNSIADGGTAKIRLRAQPTAPTGYPTMDYETQLYATNTTSIPIIRNEELILMYAEAKIRQGGAALADAVTALDKVRVAAGLATLAIAKPTIVASQSGLTDELLLQRRYGLFMEGHRWFDMRRYSRLASLPKDKPTHQIWAEFPKHKQESDWDAANVCQ